MKYLSLTLSIFFFVSCTAKPAAKPSENLVTEQKPLKMEPDIKPAGELIQGTGYEITYPEGWEVVTKFLGTDSMAKSPLVSKEDTLSENINVMVDPSAGNDGVDAYYRGNLKGLQQNLNEFVLLSKEHLNHSSGKAIDLTYGHSYQGTKLKNRAVFLLHKGIGYVLTTTATPQTFDEYYNAFDKIIHSFKLQ